MPGSAVARFSDPDKFHSSIRGAEVAVHVTQPGEFHAELTRIDLHRLWMQRGQSSLPLVARVANSSTRCSIVFACDARHPTPVIGGMEMTPADIVSEPLGAERHLRIPANYDWASMSLAVDDLAAAARTLVGRDLTAPDVARLIRPPEHLTARLRHLHGAACHLASVTPDILAHPEVARAIEQELISAMIATLDEGRPVKSIRDRRAPVMRLFEQALETHEGQPVYLTDICAEIGVTDRNLCLHCQEHLGMSPQRYLWLRRMNMVRRALAYADIAKSTVTAIALEHGFGELGRFSVQYRKLFGESPSETLRRARDEPSPIAIEPPRGPGLPILP